MKIPVIIPMYGDSEITDKCIEITKKNAGVDVDIIVVDDGTPIPYQHSGVKVLRLPENTGFTNATNQGILQALRDNPDVKYIHMLNNDTEPEPDFIKILYDAMEKYSDIGVMISTKIVEREPLLVENDAIDLTMGWHSYTNFHGDEYVRDIVWAGLTSALLRVSVMREIGMLDRRMRNYCSDNDYCFRVIQQGYRVGLVPSSRIFHIREHTTRKNGVKTGADQLILFNKLRGTYLQKILDRLPLDFDKEAKVQKYGRTRLEVYEK